MLVDGMSVPACRICLPEFDQGVANGTPVAIEHAPGHDDAFAQRLACMLTGEIVVGVADLSVWVNRSCHLRQGVRQEN
jgi:hypothetical protein